MTLTCSALRCSGTGDPVPQRPGPTVRVLIRLTPSRITTTPETTCHICGGTPSSAVVAFNSSVNATMLDASDAAMTYGRKREPRSPPSRAIAPPTITGRRGSTHGAATVRMPAAKLSRSVAVTSISRHGRDERCHRWLVVQHRTRDELACVVDEYHRRLERHSVLLPEIRPAVIVDLEHGQAVGCAPCLEVLVERSALWAPARVEEEGFGAGCRLNRTICVLDVSPGAVDGVPSVAEPADADGEGSDGSTSTAVGAGDAVDTAASPLVDAQPAMATTKPSSATAAADPGLCIFTFLSTGVSSRCSPRYRRPRCRDFPAGLPSSDRKR